MKATEAEREAVEAAVCEACERFLNHQATHRVRAQVQAAVYAALHALVMSCQIPRETRFDVTVTQAADDSKRLIIQLPRELIEWLYGETE